MPIINNAVPSELNLDTLIAKLQYLEGLQNFLEYMNTLDPAVQVRISSSKDKCILIPMNYFKKHKDYYVSLRAATENPYICGNSIIRASSSNFAENITHILRNSLPYTSKYTEYPINLPLMDSVRISIVEVASPTQGVSLYLFALK